MDVIDRIINDKMVCTSHSIDMEDTWKDFEQAIGQGGFCLFGVGEGANFYFFKYGNFAKVSMVCDNNPAIQGLEYKHFTADYCHEDNLKIQAGSELRQHRDMVVLIASLRYYDQIAMQLDSYGVKKCYSVLCMEAFERKLKRGIFLTGCREIWLDSIRKLPLNKKKICIETNCDGAGHAKEITMQLVKMRADLDVVWLVQDLHVKVPAGVRKALKRNPYTHEYEYGTARVWITDGGGGGLPLDIPKKDGQVAVELKHWSSVTLKKFALDELNLKNNAVKREEIRKNSALTDYVLVGSGFDEQTCRSGLEVKGQYVHVGSPRSDLLFREDGKEAFYTSYSGLKGKKLLLYAPTFRRIGEDMSGMGCLHELDFEIVKKALDERFGREFNILMRLHPMVAKLSLEIDYPEYVTDVSDYQDPEELVAACDALITDYSSIMFEPAYINIPVFLLATDLKEYTSRERDFYIKYQTLPFPIAANNTELMNNILRFDRSKYEADVADFLERYDVHEDGHAAERAAKFISDLIDLDLQ